MIGTGLALGLGSLAALGSIGGGLVDFYNTKQTNQSNIAINRENNAFSASEAEKQRSYESQMSNTSYQRAVADMQKAGLNPALMYGSASQASTPAAAAAHSSGNAQAKKSNLGGILSQTVTSAVMAAIVGSQIASSRYKSSSIGFGKYDY